MYSVEHFAALLSLAEKAASASNECLASRLLEQQIATLLDIFTHLTEFPEDIKDVSELFLSISTLMEEIQAWGSNLDTNFIEFSSSDKHINQLSNYNPRVVSLVEQYKSISSRHQDKDKPFCKEVNNNNKEEEGEEYNQPYLIDFTCVDCFLPFRAGMQLTHCHTCHQDLCSSCRHMDKNSLNSFSSKMIFLCHDCYNVLFPTPVNNSPKNQFEAKEEDKETLENGLYHPTNLPEKTSVSSVAQKKSLDGSVDAFGEIPVFVPPLNATSSLLTNIDNKETDQNNIVANVILKASDIEDSDHDDDTLLNTNQAEEEEEEEFRRVSTTVYQSQERLHQKRQEEQNRTNSSSSSNHQLNSFQKLFSCCFNSQRDIILSNHLQDQHLLLTSLSIHFITDLMSIPFLIPFLVTKILEITKADGLSNPRSLLSKSVGKAMAILLTTRFLDPISKFKPLSPDWLFVLIKAELGMTYDYKSNISNLSKPQEEEEEEEEEEGEDDEKKYNKNQMQEKKKTTNDGVLHSNIKQNVKLEKHRNLSDVMRKEYCSYSVAITSYLRIATQCGGLAHSVLLPCLENRVDFNTITNSSSSLLKTKAMIPPSPVTGLIPNNGSIQMMEQKLQTAKLSSNNNINNNANENNNTIPPMRRESKLLEKECCLLIGRLGDSLGRPSLLSSSPKSVPIQQPRGGAWVASVGAAKLVRTFSQLTWEASKERCQLNAQLHLLYKMKYDDFEKDKNSVSSSSSTQFQKKMEKGNQKILTNKSKTSSSFDDLPNNKNQNSRFSMKRFSSSIREVAVAANMISTHDHQNVSVDINEKMRLLRQKQKEEEINLTMKERLNLIMDAPELWEIKAALKNDTHDQSQFNAIKNGHVFHVSMLDHNSYETDEIINEKDEDDDEDNYDEYDVEEQDGNSHKSSKRNEIVKEDEDDEIEENDVGVVPEEYYHALLGSGLFLQVICPALLVPELYAVLKPPHFLPSSSQWWLGGGGNSNKNKKTGSVRSVKNKRGSVCRECNYDLCDQCRSQWSEEVNIGASAAAALIAHCISKLDRAEVYQYIETTCEKHFKVVQNNREVNGDDDEDEEFDMSDQKKNIREWRSAEDFDVVALKTKVEALFQSTEALCHNLTIEGAIKNLEHFYTEQVYYSDPEASTHHHHNGKPIAKLLQRTANQITKSSHQIVKEPEQGGGEQQQQQLNSTSGSLAMDAQLSGVGGSGFMASPLTADLLSIYSYLRSPPLSNGKQTSSSSSSSLLTQKNNDSFDQVSLMIHNTELNMKEKLIKLSNMNLNEKDFENAKKFLEVKEQNDKKKHVSEINKDKSLLLVSRIVQNNEITMNEKLFQLSELELNEKDFENAKKFVLVNERQKYPLNNTSSSSSLSSTVPLKVVSVPTSDVKEDIENEQRSSREAAKALEDMVVQDIVRAIDDEEAEVLSKKTLDERPVAKEEEYNEEEEYATAEEEEEIVMEASKAKVDVILEGNGSEERNNPENSPDFPHGSPSIQNREEGSSVGLAEGKIDDNVSPPAKNTPASSPSSDLFNSSLTPAFSPAPTSSSSMPFVSPVSSVASTCTFISASPSFLNGVNKEEIVERDKPVECLTSNPTDESLMESNVSLAEDAAATALRLIKEADILRKSNKTGTDKTTTLERAVVLYRQAIDVNQGNSAAAHYGAGVCQRKLGRHQDAITSFEQAIALDPTGNITGSRPGSLWENLAATHMRLKQYDEAAKAYEQAVLLEPSNGKVAEGAAKARSLSGTEVLKAVKQKSAI